MSVLDKKYLMISVIGSHAGEDIESIFSRKRAEVCDKEKGITYWMLQSFKARALQIQNFCKLAAKEQEDVDCLFISASSKTGAQPTTQDSVVKQISDDGKTWNALPNGFLITGKIGAQSTAIVLDELHLADSRLEIDLWEYSEFKDQKPEPIKLQLGASTICCVRTPAQGMKSRFRNVVAWGRLVSPYAVFVK